jgi:hypothetical protein
MERVSDEDLKGFGYFYNDYAQLIASNSAGVNAWLSAHPGYIGHVWFNYGSGGEDIDVSDIFRAERIEDDLANTTPSIPETPVQNRSAA